MKDGVGKCTGSQRLGLSLPRAVLERKLVTPQAGRPSPPRAPKAQGTGLLQEGGGRMRLGLRKKEREEAINSDTQGLKGKLKASLSSTFSLAGAKTGHSSQNLSGGVFCFFPAEAQVTVVISWIKKGTCLRTQAID